MSWGWIVIKLHRSEILILVFGVAAFVAFASWQAGQLEQLDQRCVLRPLTDGSCARAQTTFFEIQSVGATLINVGGVGAYLIGITLGAPVIGRDLEAGAASFVFALSLSRVRLLFERAAPGLIVAAALSGLIAVTANHLAASMLPDTNAAADFSWYGSRGLLVVAHALVAFSIGVLCGVLIGQVLPAVLLAALACASFAYGADLLLRSAMADQAVELPLASQRGALTISDVGGIVVGLPGSRYPDAVGQGLAVSLITLIGALMVGAVVIRNRRPM